MSRRLRGAARRIAGLEPVVVVIAAPFLLFPTFRSAMTVVALVALLLVWLLRWIGAGRPATATPLDLALLVLMIMIPVAVLVSVLPDLTLPKLTGLILGIAAFRATVNAVDSLRNLGWAVALYLVLGLGLALLGMVGTAWPGKFLSFQPLLGRLPSLIRGLPGAEAGIHANELAGAISLFLPLAVAVTQARQAYGSWPAWSIRVGALLLVLFLGVLLVLTGSRSAWLGVLAGLVAMALLRWRWTRWLVPGVLLLMLAVVLFVSPVLAPLPSAAPGDTFGDLVQGGDARLVGRIELWSRALYALQDFPLTGTGLGTFRRVVHDLYPLTLSRPGEDIAHAHNVFLQVGLDLGLLGLAAYLALVGVSGLLCLQVARSAGHGDSSGHGQFQWLALGILGSLVAFHMYGLTDAIALGAKPGVALWLLLAMAATLWILVKDERRHFGDPTLAIAEGS